MSVLILFFTIGLSLYTLYKNQNLLEKLLLYPNLMFKDKSFYRVLTSGFLHADLNHLIFNMLSFYFFAIPLEGIIGSLAFVLFYLGTIIISSLDSAWKHKNNPLYKSLGASGGIAGVIFCYIVFNPATTILFFFVIPIPGPIFAVAYLLYSSYASKNISDNINHDAHLWGAICGIAFAVAYDPSVITQLYERIMESFS
ncbi:rhomboid family intramembrane serine protease [Leptospira idonii]|nr:rhomboid family intramembrane serine protease [Leptospira idonii]